MASTVLVVTALEDVTADRVVAALNEREVPVVRVDPADVGPVLMFGFRLDAGRPAWRGRLRTASREVEPGEGAAVYYRRPAPYGSRFAHLPRQQGDFAAAEARHGLGGVLNALSGVRYVNHPAAVARAESKPAQLRRLARLGLRIPPTSFGLVFGCFDFALTGDGDEPEHWTAIECNPNGQWGWLPDADDITEAFAELLTVERKGRP
ncbi:MvdC/MvdD family ATP grasp protein [Streptomyces fungicidicus]|uniref:MvdC/MvdD family ATP grasp protein n=1 Tax=Streptomyces fungicidicus TaxID=68203 RepID=UPI0033E7FDA4